MRSAPSVSYPVRASRVARWICASLWAAGMGAAVAMCYRFESAGGPMLAVGLAVALSTWGALAGARQRGGRCLNWDGERWSLTEWSPHAVPSLTVALDLQSVLLVRLNVAGRAGQWLWLERCWMPERWTPLRRAVHCRRASMPLSEPASAASVP